MNARGFGMKYADPEGIRRKFMAEGDKAMESAMKAAGLSKGLRLAIEARREPDAAPGVVVSCVSMC
jgi:hypothetical protein